MIHPDHPWIEKHPDAIQTNAKGIASFMNPNPFHPSGAKWVNPDHPESKKFLFNIIKDARDRGFGYIKIDFNGIGSRFLDPTKTRLQIFRELYTLYREAAGEEMYILSCLGQPTRGVIGFIDAARVGPDSHPAHFDKCLDSVLRFQIYDNVWWQNDPDAIMLRDRFIWLTHDEIRSLALWQGIMGGVINTSAPLHEIDPDRVDLWRFLEPGPDKWTAALPYAGTDRALLLAVRRFDDRQAWAVLVFNHNDQPRTEVIQIADAVGLADAHCFAWGPGHCEPLGRRSHLAPELAPHACRLYYVSAQDTPPPAGLTLGGRT